MTKKSDNHLSLDAFIAERLNLWEAEHPRPLHDVLVPNLLPHVVAPTQYGMFVVSQNGRQNGILIHAIEHGHCTAVSLEIANLRALIASLLEFEVDLNTYLEQWDKSRHTLDVWHGKRGVIVKNARAEYLSSKEQKKSQT